MQNRSLMLAGVLALAVAGGLILYLDAQRVKPGVEEGAEPAPGPPAPPSGDSHPGTGTNAPTFSLKDISGNVVDSSRFLGKPTVINFFATWCPPCREEIPGFVEVYNKYRREGFELVGISLDTDTRGNLPAFIMDHRIEYRILMGDLSTARAYGGVSTIPTTFFIGKDGRIVNVHVGYLDRDSFDREVRKLL